MPMTAYLRKKLGDHAIGKAAFTMPASVQVALFTASPTDSGSVASEVTGGSYARLALTASMGSFDLTTGVAVNTADVNFAAPTADWGTVTYIGMLESTDMLFYEALPNPRTVLSGSRRVQFVVGQLQFRMI
jgi:hypothetical protein